MNFRLARPAYPIDINAVAGLDRLAADDGIPPIGALVRHADFEHPVDPGPLGAMLAAVARHVRHIRSRSAALSAAASRTPIRLQSGA